MRRRGQQLMQQGAAADASASADATVCIRGSSGCSGLDGYEVYLGVCVDEHLRCDSEAM